MKETVLQMKYVEAEDDRFGRAVDISLSLYAGELTIMTGLVVSGIYTVTKLLAGQIDSYRGEIWVNGQEMRQSKTKGTLQEGIAVFGLGRIGFEEFTLEENLLLHRQGKMLRMARNAVYTADEQSLLTLLDLPRESRSLTPFQQLKREIFIAYAAGVRIMVFSDLSMCCAGETKMAFQDILRFLKGRGVSLLLTVLNDQFQNFAALADACVVVRNGMTTTQLYKDGEGFDENIIHHITVGRKFVKYPPKPPVGYLDDTIVLTAESLRSGLRQDLHPGQLVGLYDENCRIPRSIEEFAAYVGENYRLRRGKESFSIRESVDFARNRIAVLSNAGGNRLLFPNFSPEENVGFFAQRFFDKKGLYSTRVASYLFDQTIEKYPELKRCKALRRRKDCMGLTDLEMVQLTTAKWLAINPEVVVMFAPANNDDIKREEWGKNLRRRLLEQGKAVLVVTSDYRVLEQEPMEQILLA